MIKHILTLILIWVVVSQVLTVQIAKERLHADLTARQMQLDAWKFDRLHPAPPRVAQPPKSPSGEPLQKL